MKTLLLISALLPCLLLAEAPTLAPVASPAKVIDGLEFSVVTQAEWRNPANISGNSEPIILQLRMTNRMDHAMLFPTFDSFVPGIKIADGKTMMLVGERTKTRMTPNILLQPGASYSMPIKAALEYKADDKAVELTVNDGTGGSATAMLPSGDHAIFIKVYPSDYNFGKDAKLPAPLWAGKGTTESVGFKVRVP